MTRGIPSRRDRQTLVAGAAVVLLLLALARGIPAWCSWSASERAKASELSHEVALVKASVASFPAMRDSLRARQTRYAFLRSSLLQGASSPGAAATLGAAASEMADAAGVRLGEVQLGDDSLHRGPLTRVWVRANGAGDVRGVSQLLLALEQGPELLSIRELSITQPEPGAPGSRAEALRISLLVEGRTLAPQTRAPRRNR